MCNCKGEIKVTSKRAEHKANFTDIDKSGMEIQKDLKTAPPPLARKLDISTKRTCQCGPTHLNCLTPKEWIKCQLGIWQFNYEGRDIRDKTKHPATFPISLARRCIELFSHQGELILDPFMGSGTTLLAARDVDRNAVGFDIHPDYIALTQERLKQDSLFSQTQQIPILDDARHIDQYLDEESIACIVTSPPYANLLNRQRKNKSRRGNERKNGQYLKVEQYSQRSEDLGTLDLEAYSAAIAEIFGKLLPLLKKKGHCIINVPDMWWENKRITIHVTVIEALRSVGYELRNTIIWDRMNIVNNVGIFGWPSNYITMGTTFEYLLDFWRPPLTNHQQTGEVPMEDEAESDIIAKTTDAAWSSDKEPIEHKVPRSPHREPLQGRFPPDLEQMLDHYLGSQDQPQMRKR
jgi:DNA modification methylase